MKRRLYIMAGTVSLMLGILGIPLPLLPTTPFLLLSAWFYSRSSDRFYNWIINHRYLGEYIRNYREKKGVPLRVKIGSIGLLWATILATAIWGVSLWWIRIILIIIALGVTFHIYNLKNIKRNRLP